VWGWPGGAPQFAGGDDGAEDFAQRQRARGQAGGHRRGAALAALAQGLVRTGEVVVAAEQLELRFEAGLGSAHRVGPAVRGCPWSCEF